MPSKSPKKPKKPKTARGPLVSSARPPAGYAELLEILKSRIRSSRIRAATAVNKELVGLYWQIGQEILGRQNREGWGAKIIDRLAADLRRSFPDMRGLSSRNLKYMRAFAESYPDEQFVQAALAQITWYHNITLLTKVKDEDERKWYLQQTVLHGWSQPVMVHQIESDLFHRKGKALTNFPATLPQPKADLAHELLKDPYSLDFLAMESDLSERKLQQSLLENLKDFLIELGKGFAFVGSQYHLEVGGQDYYLDLLFYHLSLRAYVVIDPLCGAPHNNSSVVLPVMWRKGATAMI